MVWTFKKSYYGEKKALNKQRIKDFVHTTKLNNPFTIFDDYFRHINLEGYSSQFFENIKRPFPDLLLYQKPESKFALHLSGGIDSSLLAFLFDRADADYLVCTVLGYSDAEYIAAKDFVETTKLKGRLHHIQVSPEDAFEIAKEILPRFKEPVPDSAVILSYILSKKAKELGHDLIITGDGADSAFKTSDSKRSIDNRSRIAIDKTLEPTEILGIRAFFPYFLPDLQIWAGNIPKEQKANKFFLREYAKTIGIPPAIAKRKKLGWIGHAMWCTGKIYESMQNEIRNSPFFKLLHNHILNSSEERIFREYALIKWLEYNCDKDIAINEYDKSFMPVQPHFNKPHSLKRFIQKIGLCIKERRLPERFTARKGLFYAINSKIHIPQLKFKTLLFNIRSSKKIKNATGRYLYSSPVGKDGKKFLEKIIRSFGYENFDYLIFVYDDTRFNEPLYNKCTFIYEKGLRWQFIKKYLTPEFCKKYDYLFLWADDIDIENFSYKNFIEIMKRNTLENAQPALTHKSYHFWKITLKDERFKIGRFTDFVEIMIPVFTREAWNKFWKMIEVDGNPWGRGYDSLTKSVCAYTNMGIIDCEPVTHTRPVRKTSSDTLKEYEKFIQKYRKYKKSMVISYGKLK